MSLYAPSAAGVTRPSRFAPQSAFLMGLPGVPYGSVHAASYLVTERPDNPRLEGLGCEGSRQCAACASAEQNQARLASLDGLPLGLGQSLADLRFEAEISDEEIRGLASFYDQIADAAEPVRSSLNPFAPWSVPGTAALATGPDSYQGVLLALADQYPDAPKFAGSLQAAAAAARALADFGPNFSDEDAARQRVRLDMAREAAIDLRGLAATGVREPFGVDEPVAASIQAQRKGQFLQEVRRHSFCADPLGWLGEPGRAARECVPWWVWAGGALLLLGGVRGLTR